MSRKTTKLPGFCDVHVHLREPGFSYKETILSGSEAAAHGGYTDVCAMPNLRPVPDSVATLGEEWNIINRDAKINVWPYSAITAGQAGAEIVDIEGLWGLPKWSGVSAADLKSADEEQDIKQQSWRPIAFSDDGVGIQDAAVMEEAMRRAAECGALIVAHCEVNNLLHGGYIHDGEYAATHGHKGICSASEYKMVERDLELAGRTGCRYHICHVSSKESVEAIRAAKDDGVNVTCETAPHYLLLSEDDLKEDGRWKMNPPLRGRADRDALIAGVKDGTIDVIATDHAPHSEEEKSRGLEKSLFGITGIEIAFPLLYTYLVKEGVLPLERIIEMLTTVPRSRFGIAAPQLDDTHSEWDLEERFVVEPDRLLSKGKATPFEGHELYGVNKKTVLKGQIVYKE